jgi:AcrR family transcriptional regulator
MVARAKAAAATGERILDAAVDIFWASRGKPLSLDEVARRADVSVQTVIRRFGGRDALLAAAAEREFETVRHQRDRARVGDVAGAVCVLLDHYEEVGDRTLMILAEQERGLALHEIAEQGRVFHRAWCARVFAPALVGRTGVQRERRLAQLVAVCDVYTWKLLRRDSGLSRRQTELAMVELLEPMLRGS